MNISRRFADRLLRQSIRLLLPCLALWLGCGELGAASFAYIETRMIVTVEFSSSRKATVNIFNLTGYVLPFQANRLCLFDVSGKFYLGQVIALEKATTESDLYAGASFIPAWDYRSLEVLGAYPEPQDIGQVILLQGGKRLILKAQSEGEFQELAARIEALDLKKQNGQQILALARIAPRGEIRYPTGEQDEVGAALEKVLGAEEINPPRILSRKLPRLTEEARRAGVDGRVRLSVQLDRHGQIKEIKVQRGLGHGLDERAVAAVRNSWEFLPATKRSEPVAVSMAVEVSFEKP